MGVAEGCQSVLLLWNGERGHNLPHVSAGGAGSTPDDPSSAGLFLRSGSGAGSVFLSVFGKKRQYDACVAGQPAGTLCDELSVRTHFSDRAGDHHILYHSARMPGKPVYLYTVSVRCAVGTGWCDIFAYSLAVFVAMFTGQAFAMPCYYVIVNYLYVGCMFIVAKVIETISYGIENAWNPGKSCIYRHFII